MRRNPTASHDDQAGRAIAARLKRDLAIPTARSGIPVNQILDGAAFWTATQLMGAGKFEEAAECALDLLARYGEHPEALYVLGFVAFYGQDDPATAADLFRRSLAHRPNFPEGQYNLGYMLQRLGGHDDEVIQCYTRAIELDPRFAGAWVNLGNAKLARADVEGALECYENAKHADASNALARYNRSIAYLLTGGYAAGWADYEARLETPLFKGRVKLPQHLPLWDGTPLNGRRLLVCAEQGIGDTIMCYRYAAQLPGAVWCVQGPLVPLLGGVDYAARPWPEADCYVPTMSLMHRLGQPTAGRPYLVRNDPQDRTTGRRVGYVYAGSPDHENNRRRTIPKDLFGRLFDVPVEWVSLQYGDGFHPADWAETAQRLAHCDLVISVDTAVAHLAGAMGIPVWILLPSWPDYRWGLESTTSHWYDSATLYRQTTDGDWASVLDRVIADLNAWRVR